MKKVMTFLFITLFVVSGIALADDYIGNYSSNPYAPNSTSNPYGAGTALSR